MVVHEPLVKVLRMVDGDDKTDKGYLYDAMDRAKESIKESLKTSYRRWWRIIDKRWDKQLHQDIHAAGYFLNPRFQYGINAKIDNEVLTGFKHVADKLVPDIRKQIAIHDEAESYRLKDGYFGSHLAYEASRSFTPARWWSLVGREAAPNLTELALHIVFAMLDTQSLCHAAATCSMFKKCAIDPMCYADIDLTTVMPKVNNAVVSTMIQRAGRNLQSLKLGILPNSTSTSELTQSISYSRNSMNATGLSWNERRPRQGRESSVLTRSCLLALSSDGGVAGALLRRLHLYNIDKLDCTALCTALSACGTLLDLKVIGLHVELRRTLDVVSTSCHSIECLFIESSDAGRDDSLNSTTCTDLVNGCPNIRSLAIRGYNINDHKIRIMLKGFRCLKVADFSTSFSITGVFLRNLGCGTYAQALEVLILRDCLHLKEVEVAGFLSAVLGGDCKLLRYLDISNKDGLSAEEDWNYRCYNPSIPISRLLEERPDIFLIADFPPDGSFMDIEDANDSDISSSTSLQMMYNTELIPYLSSFDSSYSSDQGSGNEDSQDVNFAFYDGYNNFDEAEFQFS